MYTHISVRNTYMWLCCDPAKSVWMENWFDFKDLTSWRVFDLCDDEGRRVVKHTTLDITINVNACLICELRCIYDDVCAASKSLLYNYYYY